MKQFKFWLNIWKSPTSLLSLVFIVAKFISVSFSLWASKWISCNVHEFIHLTAAYFLKIPIDETSWCGPGLTELNGEVIPKFTESSIRFTTFYGSGGVLSGAIFLAVTLHVFGTKNINSQSITWHIVGILLTVFATAQILFGLYEGFDHVAYQQRRDSGTILFIGALIGLALYMFAIRKTYAFNILTERKKRMGKP